MNWFKKIAKNYGEIGHSGVGSGNNNLLWMCNPDGSNFVTEEGWAISGHGEMVDWDMEKVIDNKFRGRFDPDTKEVSIATPSNWYYRIPKNIINKLYESFGDDIQILVYSSVGDWKGIPISELV